MIGFFLKNCFGRKGALHSMIEIIREEEWDRAKEQNDGNERALPKDIRQMGKPDIGDRIYVEDRVYQKLHDYEEPLEKAVYVLLGRFENYFGKQCVFIEALIPLEEITFEGGLPVWNDRTWAYLYKKLCQAYDNMVIVGWAMDIRGQLPNMTVRIEKLHNANFGGTHQVLFLMDGLEREEAFYCSEKGHLRRREGYYIYYDRKTPFVQETVVEEEKPEPEPQPVLRMESQPETERELFFRGEHHSQHDAGKDDTLDAQEADTRMNYRQGTYRRQVMEKEERKSFFPAHSASVVLALIACVLGYNAYRNYEKMNAMEETLARMNNTVQLVTATEEQEETEKTEQTSAAVVRVEEAAGTIEKQQETESTTETVISEENKQQQEDGMTESEEAGTDKTQDGQAEQAEQTESSQETAAEDTQVVTETMTESEKYLTQGYYIVQKGENLAAICRKVYQSTAMMDKLCEANGIDDPDAIYAGQCLTLPN